MRVIDLNSEYLGVSTLQLMENAGRAVADEALSHVKSGEVVVFAGTGRNGGDGMVAGRHLAGAGFRVRVYLVGREADLREECTVRNWKALKSMGSSVKLSEVRDSSQLSPANADVIIDALLGTGAKGKLRPPISMAVKAINESKGFKVAVDLPSGLDSDGGERLGEIVQADATLTFHRMKVGLEKAGIKSVKVVSIGVPPEAELYAGPGDVKAVCRSRHSESHKGQSGRVLVIGGSDVYTGAPALVALAALRTGVDLAYVAAPEKTAYAISSFSPDLITVKLEGPRFTAKNVEQLHPLLAACDCIAVGPGMGLHDETIRGLGELFKQLSETKKPTLIDADAIKACGRLKAEVKAPVVFTPHIGEYYELTGRKVPDGMDGRVECVTADAKKFGTILLKGAVDIISDGRRVKLNFTGNPAMTAGGTGDVLSGIVAALLAQGFNPFESSIAGAFINGAAGDYVYRERGYHLVASDLLEYIPQVMRNPMAHKELLAEIGRA